VAAAKAVNRRQAGRGAPGCPAPALADNDRRELPALWALAPGGRSLEVSQAPYVASAERYENAHYRRCGRSGLALPAISLGLWQNFGEADSFEAGGAILRRAFDRGVTHFDLANNYGPPPGAAEERFGRMFAADFSAHRDEIVVSSKAGYLMWPGPYGEWGSRKYLLASLDASLKRLGLDYVDIFYHHRPDPNTPIEETMSALADAVRQGKALYVGVSNYRSAQTTEAIATLRRMGVACLVNQVRYSLLERDIEADGLLATLAENGAGCVAFSPLRQGILTGKYLAGIPQDSRAQRGSRGGSMGREGVTEAALASVRRLGAIAARLGVSLTHLALKWVLRDERMTSAVIGARTVAQLDDCLDALDGPALSPAIEAEIDAALASA
jgi:L-glyceraldehyde 3-phosphate reductase